MDSKQIVELNVLMLALQKELQDFRRENQSLHEDLRVLKKVFAYKEKKVSDEDFVQAKVNARRMRIYAKC